MSHGERARRRGRRRANGRRSDRASGRQSPITDPEEARAICLKQLSWAPRTRSQLARAMRRRGVTDEVAEQILARFEDVGLIDDTAFAASWVESRHIGRSVGRRKLAQELYNRGVAGAIVRDAVDALPVETERATAYALISRRLASTAGQPTALRARRLAGILARKGYPAGLAYDVVREALAAEGHDLPEVDIPEDVDEQDAGGR